MKKKEQKMFFKIFSFLLFQLLFLLGLHPRPTPHMLVMHVACVLLVTDKRVRVPLESSSTTEKRSEQAGLSETLRPLTPNTLRPRPLV